MTGFQIFLCVIAGIILLLILILSVPVHITFAYSDKIFLTVRYLFIKLDLLPIGEKKQKKKKTKEKPKQDEKTDEKKKKTAEGKKPNKLLEMVKANGYDGMMLVLSNLRQVLSLYGGKLLRSVVFDEIEIYAVVGTGDAASTAVKYGKTCQLAYPFVGFLCSNNVVKRYDVDVQPDFLANSSRGEMNLEFHLIIRKIINATVAMAVRLVFKVLLKFLKGAKKNKMQTEPQLVKEAQAAEINSGN